MFTLAGQRINLSAIAVAFAAALAMNVLVPPEHVLLVLLGIGAAALMTLYIVRGDLLSAILGWFVALICFDMEFWRLVVPGFFNLTIPRVLMVVLLLAFLGMLALGRFRFRLAGRTSALVLLLVACFTASAVASGFETIGVATVHYRLIGGYWFAAAVFFLAVHAVREPRHLDRIAWFFFAVGLYLTFTGWCEHLKFWDAVFPSYIADPDRGIHWGRVRGPFLVSPMLGVALIFCLFGNLYLARRAETLRRWALYVACLLMLPVIFWTQTRSVWLAAIACASIWLLAGSHRRPRIVLVCVATALAIAALVVNWANVSSVERSRGGVAEAAPIELRFALAKLTFDIAADHPLFGVGFGHFRDHAARYARDPSSPAMQVASTAVEHNNFLSVLAETGVVGLAIYLWLLLHLLWRSVRLYRRMPAGFLDGRGRDFVVLYWVLYANHVVDAMFRETSVHPFDNCLFFAVSGAMVAIDLMARRQGSTAPVPTA